MEYANILTLAAGAEEDAITLKLGAELAARDRACLRVLSVMPEVPVTGWEGWGAGSFTGELWTAIMDANTATQEKLAERAKAVAKAADLPFGALEGPGLVLLDQAVTLWQGLADELPLADLVIAGSQSVGRDGPWTGILAEAVMERRAPLLIARDAVPPAGRPAAVLWDASLQAGHAARAAVPLLRQASEVLIVQQYSSLDAAERERADPARLQAYLRRRGISSTSVVRALSEGEDALENVALQYKPGLLVAGAYGHSRLSEALVGGATRRLLAMPDGPNLFIAH